MTREELEKRLESAEKQMLGLQDEIQNLKSKLAEVQDEPEIPDYPTFKTGGEDFWHINSSLKIVSGVSQGGKKLDYNYFHTVDYAHEFCRKCLLIAMMLHCKWYLDRYYVPNWKNVDENKFIVYYDNRACCFHITQRTLSDVGHVAFSTPDAARKCAEWLNEHWRGSE